jgi:hypothetical protein
MGIASRSGARSLSGWRRSSHSPRLHFACELRVQTPPRPYLPLASSGGGARARGRAVGLGRTRRGYSATGPL